MNEIDETLFSAEFPNCRALEAEDRGEAVDRESLQEKYPEHSESLIAFFSSHDLFRAWEKEKTQQRSAAPRIEEMETRDFERGAGPRSGYAGTGPGSEPPRIATRSR